MSGQVAASAYAYPWDIAGDPSAPDLIAALGVESVVVAAAYHSVRAATPRHPRHRVVEADAALYVPVRSSAWAGRRLAPADGAVWSGDESFVRARQAMESVGLAVAAWVVLTHSTAAGVSAPDLQVRNAFGDRYPYALCPAAEEVRDYASRLVGEVVDQAEVDSLIIETCGQMGVEHPGRHDRTTGADWSDVDRALLSVCFCTACRAGLDQGGVDADHVASRIRDAVGARAASIGDAVGPDLARAVLDLRHRSIRALRDVVVQRARDLGITQISMHVAPDPWEIGPASPIIDDDADIDRHVVHTWDITPTAYEKLRDVRQRAPGTRTAAYVTALPPAPADRNVLASHWGRVLESGADELHVFHAGLASDRRLALIASVIADLRAVPARPTNREEIT